jgi:hypothetical protein
MRFLGLLLVVLALLLPTPSIAQSTSATASQNSASKDPQAVNILNEALVAAGGTQAISAIADYQATGNITYRGSHDTQGTVTIKGLGSRSVRIDANLPAGVRSWSVNDGMVASKMEDGTVFSQMSSGKPVPSSDAYPFRTPLFPGSLAMPYSQLVTVLNSPGFSVSYKGVVQEGGHSLYDIRFERVRLVQVSASAGRFQAWQPRGRDVLIDTSTFQIAAVKEAFPKNIVVVLQYADYRAVNGVLVPFSIIEESAGQQAWVVTLDQVTFNTGLQDSAFTIQ